MLDEDSDSDFEFGGKSKSYKAIHGLLDRIDHSPR
jgi:hypothetical protein